jgi:ankyrin repeat protein
LHIACHYNNINCVEFLIRELDIDPNILFSSSTKSNCLHIATKAGNFQIFKFLIENSKVNLRQLTSNHDDIMMMAIIKDDY